MNRSKKIAILLSSLIISITTYTLDEGTYMFQPADGSFENGIYKPAESTATTTLYTYENVFIFDGTDSTPELSSTGTYINDDEAELLPIGSFSIYSDKNGENKIYYLFGSKIEKQTKKYNEAQSEPIKENA